MESVAFHILGDDDWIQAVLPWLAVLGAWLCFGTFAVPMKWPSVVEAKVDPLVFQAYKTWWTFATSFLVLLFYPFEFTWWGLASGISWVPAGVAAVIAVQNVGIACGQALWQITIIITSFIWGFAILRDEQVKDWYGTSCSLLCLTVGVLGMTWSITQTGRTQRLTSGRPRPKMVISIPSFLRPRSRTTSSSGSEAGTYVSMPDPAGPPAEAGNDAGTPADATAPTEAIEEALSPRTQMQLQRRRRAWITGISAALFNGVWGGACLVPSHFSPISGVHYVISFGFGALIANILLLLAYFIWLKANGLELPPFSVRVMAVPGFLSGTLWAAGNFCSLYVVSTLGQGIGYSMVQGSVVVSGLWGLLYYQEISGRPVLYWCMACALCGVGMAGLAFEKQ